MTEKKNDDWDEFEEQDEPESTDGETKAEDEQEVAVELDPEDPAAVPEQFYTVQIGDDEQEAGTRIQVKCGNCAVWEAPLAARAGKPLCRAGRPTKVMIGDQQYRWRMNEERYSCQTYFVPQELSDVLGYITDDPQDVKMLQWAFPVIKRLIALQQRIRDHYERHDLGSSTKAVNNVLDFTVLFSSEEQVQYVRPFINYMYEGLKTHQKKTAARRDTFKGGDEISWEVIPGGERIRGFIRSIGGRKRLITLVVSGKNAQVLQPEHAATWQEQHPDEPLVNLKIQMQYEVAAWQKLAPKLASEIMTFSTVEDD